MCFSRTFATRITRAVTTASSWPSTVLAITALGIPLAFGLAALGASARDPFRRIRWAAGTAGALASAVALGHALIPRVASPWLDPLVRIDPTTAVMLVLVCAITIVIVRFSATYLEGDPDRPRYARALAATLTSVTVLVLANDLLVIAIAWLATSLALHPLLTFYRDRRQAQLAAHKKFLLSRVADACVLAAVALIGSVVGSVKLDEIAAWVGTRAALPIALHVAGVLLVLGVALKAAQLPFHGWLTQVMEAPTPVSALLHAGIVNIGGFVMIRLAPLMAHLPIAQTLLVAIGTTTAVVASLVMTTRVSVKVALAWSTCAQLGFMLVQCGLGAWHLALLHLVAHSLYKAHAFLSAGSTVARWRVRALAPRPPPTALSPAVAAAFGALGVVAVGFVAYGMPAHDPGPWLLAGVFGVAVAPLVATPARGRVIAGLALRAGAATALYLGWHVAASALVVRPQGAATTPLAWMIAAVGFALLFVVQRVLLAWPTGRLARALQPVLFAGLYLDERFTRLMFRVWPPRLEAAARAAPSRPLARTTEVPS